MKPTKNKILSLLIAMTMLFAMIPTTLNFVITANEGEELLPIPIAYRCGDIEGNGDVGIMDALEILKCLAGITNEIDKPDANPKALRAALLDSAADATAPGIMDALEILKKLAGIANVIDGRCDEFEGCERCPDQIDITPEPCEDGQHLPGTPATCGIPQTCTNCAEVLTPALMHTWVKNNDGTHNCITPNGCGTANEACSPSANAGDLCMKCAFVKPEPCTVGDHTPGAPADCVTPQSCTVCLLELAPALGHTPDMQVNCLVCTVCSAAMPARTCTVLAPCAAHICPNCDQPYDLDGNCDCCPDCRELDCICIEVQLMARRNVHWLTNRSDTPVKITGNGTYEIQVTLPENNEELSDVKIRAKGGAIAFNPSDGEIPHEAYADAKVTVNWITAGDDVIPHTFPEDSPLLYENGRINVVLYEWYHNAPTSETKHFASIGGEKVMVVNFTISDVVSTAPPLPCPTCAKIECICTGIELSARRQVGAWTTLRSSIIIAGNGTYQIRGSLPSGSAELGDVKIRPLGANVGGDEPYYGDEAPAAYANAVVTINEISVDGGVIEHTFPPESRLLTADGLVNIVLYDYVSLVKHFDSISGNSSNFVINFTISGVE